MANGNFLVSYDGKNMVLNGGICPTNGLGGRPERFKTTTALSLIINSMARQPGSELYIYDSEGSLTDRYRLASFSDLYLEDPIKREEHLQELVSRIVIKQTSDFEDIDDFMRFLNENVYVHKEKLRKDFTIDTPFVNEETDKRRRAMAPTYVLIDSWSHGKTKAGMLASSAVDASDPGNTMQFMRDSAAKNTTLARMVNTSPRLGIYFFLTAHIGDKIDMAAGPMSKPSKDLQSMKAKDKLKKVGSDYLFLVNGNWSVDSSVWMENRDDKGSEYPYSDRSTSPHEFSEVTVGTTRGKRRGSGDKISLVISQTNGLCTYLTNLNFLKQHKFYGLGTDKTRPRLPFFPDIQMPRKKVHQVLPPNYQLRRALEITAQLCYLQHYWTTPEDMTLPPAFRGMPFNITPEELADRLEKSGKKDEVLNSRGWWSYGYDDIPYYTIFDILRMVRDAPGTEEKK